MMVESSGYSHQLSVISYQEFYIRHTDGTPISSEAERQRVIQCLQASVERRTSQVHALFDRVINQIPRYIIQKLQAS